MRLGSVEEHAILLASMLRGVKYETSADLPLQTSKISIDEDHKLEDRVFVCLGKSKDMQGGTRHAWVMTLS
jgi:hypothetical protein